MTGVSNTDFELLNALSDDELSGLEKEKLLSRLQNDDALKLAYAEILDVKEKLSLIHTPDISIVSARPKSNRVRNMALAASVAVIIAISALSTPFLPSNDAASNTALAWHEIFSDNRYVVTKEQKPLFISISAQADIPVPDLSPSKLFLVEYKLLGEKNNDPSAAIHYRGLNGCRVTLWVGPNDGTQMLIDDTYLQQHWAVSNLDYQVIATGMDKKRFETVVGYIKSITKPELKDENETQLLMASAYAEAKPCA